MAMNKITIDSILGQPEPTLVELVLIPAYGRNYNSDEAVKNDWNNGKDFKILNGPYCSIDDLNHLKMISDILIFTSLDGKEMLRINLNLKSGI